MDRKIRFSCRILACFLCMVIFASFVFVYNVSASKVERQHISFNPTGTGYPMAISSYDKTEAGLNNINDGLAPYGNRYWTNLTEPLRTGSDWIGIDFEYEHAINMIELYIYGDNALIKPPEKITLQYWDQKDWKDIPGLAGNSAAPRTRRNAFAFDEVRTTKIRAVMDIQPGTCLAVSEMKVYGERVLHSGFELSFPEEAIARNEAAFPVKIRFNKALENHTNIYLRFKDFNVPRNEIKQKVSMVKGENTKDIKVDLTVMSVGEVEVIGSLNEDYSNPMRYYMVREFGPKAIQDIYEEVKAPYDYGVVLNFSGAEGEFDSDLVDNPHVFRDGDWWYMTFNGHDGKGDRAGIARSKDLLNWEKLGMILDRSGVPGTWDRYNANGFMIRDHVWGKAPTAHKKDGRYVIAFRGSVEAGYEQGTHNMGLAFADVITGPWEKWPNNPVMMPEMGYEKDKIWKSHIIWDGSRYINYYNAGWGPEIMCMAYSDDLLDWTREENNPLLTVTKDESGNQWGAQLSADADVVKIGDTWVMFYFTDSPHSIIDTFALSKDMVHWQKSYVPLRSTDKDYNSLCAHKPCVFKYEGVVYHFYCSVGMINGKKVRNIALATSERDIETVVRKQLEKESSQDLEIDMGSEDIVKADNNADYVKSDKVSRNKESISLITAFIGALIFIAVGLGFIIFRKYKVKGKA